MPSTTRPAAMLILALILVGTQVWIIRLKLIYWNMMITVEMNYLSLPHHYIHICLFASVLIGIFQSISTNNNEFLQVFNGRIILDFCIGMCKYQFLQVFGYMCKYSIFASVLCKYQLLQVFECANIRNGTFPAQLEATAAMHCCGFL